jgi:hypothetical protein
MATQSDDLNYGFRKEMENSEIISNHLGTYMMKLPQYHPMDWVECIPSEGLPFYAEQKARNVSYEFINNCYGGEVLIGKNKTDFMKAHGEGILYFDLRGVLYYIQYDEKLFDTFRVKKDFIRGLRDDCYDKEHEVIYIPTKYLSRVAPGRPSR